MALPWGALTEGLRSSQASFGATLELLSEVRGQTEFWEGGRVAVFLNRIHSVFIRQIFEALPYAKACSSSGNRQNRTDKVLSLWSWHSSGGEARQGTSKISKQDHFPESARRKIKRTMASGVMGEGRRLCHPGLGGVSWRR